LIIVNQIYGLWIREKIWIYDVSKLPREEIARIIISSFPKLSVDGISYYINDSGVNRIIDEYILPAKDLTTSERYYSDHINNSSIVNYASEAITVILVILLVWQSVLVKPEKEIRWFGNLNIN
jgi:hypothetical protein